jgi:outer membrane cobalamin receptor
VSLRAITAGLFILAVSSFGAPALSQVPDSARAPHDLVIPDSTGAAADSTVAREITVAAGATALADTGAAPLLRGAGSIATGATPVVTLPDSDAAFIPVRTAGDLATEIDGLFLTTAGLGEIGRKYSVHGQREGSVAFLADGLLLNSPATGLFDANLYPVDFAERIEFASAPGGFSSALNAVGGAMNFVSRAARNPRPSSHLFYTQSAYNLTIVDAFIRQDVARGLNVDLGLQRPVADGRFQNSAIDAWNARLKLRCDFEGVAVYASDVFNRWERGLNDGISPATPDSLRYDQYLAVVVNESATEKILRHDAAAGVTAGSDTAALTGFDLQYSWVHREYRDEAGGTGSTGTAFRDTREEETSGFRFSHSRSIAWTRVSAVAEFRNRRLLSDPNIGAAQSTQAAASVSVRATPLAFLSIIPAGRYERFLDIDRFSYSAIAEARIAPWLGATGGFSRSFRYPSFAEVRGVAGLAQPLTAADPERHDVASIGISAGDSSGTRASATYFHRGVLDGVILDSSGVADGAPLSYVRTAYETRDGVTLSGSLRVGSFVAEVDAAWLAYGEGSRRRYAPEWDVRGGIYFNDRIVDGHLRLKTGFRGRHFSSYDGEGYGQRYGLFLPSGYEVQPAGVVDFILFAGIGDAVIHLVWENLLGAEYAMTVFYPADDRSFRLGVGWKFLN